MKQEINDKTKRFCALLRVRVNDLNYGNHLCHTKIACFFHQARVEYLNSLGYTEGNIEGAGIIVKTINIELNSEAFLNDELKINIDITNVGKSSFEMKYIVRNLTQNKLTATGNTLLIFFNHDKKRIMRTPPAFLNKFS